MNISITVTQKQLSELLLNIAVVRPVFIWGPPGIGKSSLVQQFAESLGMPCVSLLGSQLEYINLRPDHLWSQEDRDILYFLSQSFRAQLNKQLPQEKEAMGEKQKRLAHRAKALIKELASISLEMAQMVVAKQGEEEGLPGWFMVDIVRDLPRLAERKEA